VLARTLRRISADTEAAYGHPVLLVETFTDPARHQGTCYKAANFLLAGETSGYGRRNGTWVDHGNKKLCWLYPLRRDARAILASPFDHPMLSSSAKRKANMVDLNQVVIEGERGLYARLTELPDHRKPKGVRHKLAAILLVCAAAVLAGNHNPTEKPTWPRSCACACICAGARAQGSLSLPRPRRCNERFDASTGKHSTRIVCETLAEQVHARRADEEHDSQEEAVLFGVAVDGKSLRGAIQDDGRAVHLFAAMAHDERAVIGQEEVDHKTNEIKASRPLLSGLDLAGCIVTADAMHAQRDHAEFLVEEKHADFLLFVKENQPSFYHTIAGLGDEVWSHRPIAVTALTGA
jgi:hypothetical protein